MKLGFVRLVVIFAAFVLSGAPTVLMQLGAWGMMIGQRGEKQAVTDIVRVALLGTEPCQRCRVIGNGVGTEQRGEMDLRELAGMRLINFRRETAALVIRNLECPIMILSVESLRPGDRSDRPPTPPPRQGFVS